MKELLVATHNLHKKEEIQQILGDRFLVKSLTDVGYHEEIEENGSSFFENALIKAQTCYLATEIPCIGDDSGLSVDALDGRPGIYSARYASDHDFDKNIEKVLEEMEGKEDRKAHFVTVLCYFTKDGPQYFEGKVYGNLIEENKGHKGFGYDPIFVPEGYDKTFAEMDPEEKNEISHRRNAFDKFLAELDRKN